MSADVANAAGSPSAAAVPVAAVDNALAPVVVPTAEANALNVVNNIPVQAMTPPAPVAADPEKPTLEKLARDVKRIGGDVTKLEGDFMHLTAAHAAAQATTGDVKCGDCKVIVPSTTVAPPISIDGLKAELRKPGMANNAPAAG